MVRASSETLLTTDTEFVAIEQTTKEFPASRDLVAGQTLLLCDEINSGGCGHTPGKSVNALLLEVWDFVGMVGNDGQ